MLARLLAMRMRVPALTAVLCLVTGLFAAPGAAQTPRDLLRVERALLERDLDAYESIRDAELTTAYVAIEAAEALDELLLADGADLEAVEEAARQQEVAQENAYGALRRAVRARARLVERQRRIAVLLDQLGGTDALVAETGRIDGRWRIEITSGTGGMFNLRLDGSVIGGGYEMDDGRRGSLRGSLIGTRIQLERLDDEKGLDGVFDGSVDPVAGTARGVWTPTILGAGEPGGSSWTGERLEDEESLDDEDLPVVDETDATDLTDDEINSGSA